MSNERFAGKMFEDTAPPARSASVVRIEGHRVGALDPECSKSPPVAPNHSESFAAAHENHSVDPQFRRDLGRKIVILESRIFLRGCFQRSIESALSIPVETLASISELDERRNSGQARLLIISVADGNNQEGTDALGILSELAGSVPTIVLSSRHNFELMRTVIGHGAKGYIPMTMGFEIAIEAVRFVLAGGTYVPAECFLSGMPPASPPPQGSGTPGAITARESSPTRLSRTS
jgi:DNA-binding NarL/FixJ family response regulator